MDDLNNMGPGDPAPIPAVVPPKNYAPLSVQQRQDWNAFLDYLGKKGIGGSKDLDARDKSLGLSYLKQYQKENPNTTITPDVIPQVQYDQYLIRKGDSFNGLSPEQMAYLRKGLTRPDGTSPYLSRPVSDVDGWLGSLTSKQYYPTARRGTNLDGSFDFGVNIEDYVNSLSNKDLAEKYRVKTK